MKRKTNFDAGERFTKPILGHLLEMGAGKKLDQWLNRNRNKK